MIGKIGKKLKIVKCPLKVAQVSKCLTVGRMTKVRILGVGGVEIFLPSFVSVLVLEFTKPPVK